MRYIKRMEQLDTDYIGSQISVSAIAGPVDPTTFPVAFAFMLDRADPTADDFHPGEWITFNNQNFARILIGPGSAPGAFAPGFYKVHIRITATPAIPIKVPGFLQIV